jgi:hypothetical protein
MPNTRPLEALLEAFQKIIVEGENRKILFRFKVFRALIFNPLDPENFFKRILRLKSISFLDGTNNWLKNNG